MSALSDLADAIDPRDAQVAVARACAAAGAVEEWDSQTIEWVLEALISVLPAGTPNPGQTSDDELGLAFWQAIEATPD